MRYLTGYGCSLVWPTVITSKDRCPTNTTVLGSLISTLFATRDYFFDGNAPAQGVPTDCIFLVDGTLFIVQNKSYTTLFKLPATTCKETPYTGIYVWR